MPVYRSPLVLLLILVLALAPMAASARAGSTTAARPGLPSFNLSQGSRGSRSYDDYGVAPLERSLAPANSVIAATRPIWSALLPDLGGTLLQRHPFLAAMAGGAAGLWLGDILSGGTHEAYATATGQMGGAAGSLLTVLLFAGLGWFVWRRHRSGGTAAMGLRPWLFGGGTLRQVAPSPALPHAAQPSLTLTDADFAAFGDVLGNVQRGWSEGDLTRLKDFTTPEMLSYFAEQLASNQSLGVQNRVESIMLRRGETREAWQEGPVDYATAILRWRAFDYTIRLGRQPSDPDFLVGGDPRNQVEAVEAWTFRRARGGRWLLSAIQQLA